MNLRGKVDHTVTLEQVPKWCDQESVSDLMLTPQQVNNRTDTFPDPLTSPVGENSDYDQPSKFPVHEDINSKLYLWRGPPWNIEVDAVVNSTNEHLQEAASSPGIHEASGPGLAEECLELVASLGQCKAGDSRVTSAYNLPARRIIHTVGPKYNAKFHTAAENSLSHCYRSCLEALVEHDLTSIAFGCLYSESKGFPREQAAHIAIRTIRRFLERFGHKVSAIVMCTVSTGDTDIYRRLLPLYFPRFKSEEDAARSRLPADTGDENGETSMSERRIRISALPGPLPLSSSSSSLSFQGLEASALLHRSFGNLPLNSRQSMDALVDPLFMAVMKDPDERRRESWERAAMAQAGWPWAKLIGLQGLGGPPLTAVEEDSLHARYLAEATATDLEDIAEMKILYHGGRDVSGRPLLVVVGAHFLPRAMNLDRFVLYAVQEFEKIIRKPFAVVYFHSETHLPVNPNFGWMRRLHNVIGRKHRQNLQMIYVVHPTLGLKAAVATMKILVDGEVWRKVTYVDRLLELFRYTPRESVTIPEFVFQYDIEVNPQDAVGLDARQRQNRILVLGPP